MMKGKGMHRVSFLLVVICAINWGLIGLFEFNLVGLILSAVPAIERIVYVLIGLAGVYLLMTHKHDCRTCTEEASVPKA